MNFYKLDTINWPTIRSGLNFYILANVAVT
jgi:hypothetical protein